MNNLKSIFKFRNIFPNKMYKKIYLDCTFIKDIFGSENIFQNTNFDK